jgi:hypothetical protein
MGLSLKKITRQINLKNVSPVARAVSLAKPTAQKVIETKNIGIKDIVELSPLGIATNLVQSGTSTITDVVMDKPILPEPAILTPIEKQEDLVKPAPAVASAVAPAPAPKPNTLMYAGIGVGVLVLGYFGYRLMKK